MIKTNAIIVMMTMFYGDDKIIYVSLEEDNDKIVHNSDHCDEDDQKMTKEYSDTNKSNNSKNTANVSFRHVILSSKTIVYAVTDNYITAK